MVKYYKIVRDKIPDIIRKDGGICETRTVSSYEAIKYLIDKIGEEATELKVAGFVEGEMIRELADILECVRGIADKMSVPMDRIEFVRAKRAAERGSFNKNIILMEATTQENV